MLRIKWARARPLAGAPIWRQAEASGRAHGPRGRPLLLLPAKSLRARAKISGAPLSARDDDNFHLWGRGGRARANRQRDLISRGPKVSPAGPGGAIDLRARGPRAGHQSSAPAAGPSGALRRDDEGPRAGCGPPAGRPRAAPLVARARAQS